MKYSLFFAFFCLLTFSCKKNVEGDPGENEMWLLYKSYKPNQLIIKKGVTATFISKDNSSHTVTANNLSFDSGIIKSGETYTHVFDSVGTYNIYCKYHPTNVSEQGAVVVR